MVNMSRLLFLTFLMCVVASVSAEAVFDGKPDYEREKRLADEIRDVIFDGEVLDLSAEGRDFMAIHMEPETEAKGAVILVHGRGYHPDWEDVVNPLRIGLAEQGWHTLSLQMPVLAKSAKYYDYVPLFPAAGPRIEAGIKYLESQGVENIVLFAHSCGAHMALNWITRKGDGQIDGFIGAGMGATDYRQPMIEAYPLDQMKVPVLDMFGSEEHPAVIRMAPARKAAMKRAGNPLSEQKILPDADHYFTGVKEPLVELVSSWLNKLH